MSISLGSVNVQLSLLPLSLSLAIQSALEAIAMSKSWQMEKFLSHPEHVSCVIRSCSSSGGLRGNLQTAVCATLQRAALATCHRQWVNKIINLAAMQHK